MTLDTSFLILEDGTQYQGMSPTWQNSTFDGEVVFTTGMTGYFESLTDPSFAGQHLVFTYPLMGNYGVPESSQWESSRIHTSGVIVSELCQNWSHFQGIHSLMEWLEAQQVPLITGIDTRDLTKRIRERGVMLGAITKSNTPLKSIQDPNLLNLVERVSISNQRILNDSGKRIIVVDCGIKNNILRCLDKYPVTLHHVPHNYDYLDDEFDGIFISNGPGNPEMCQGTIAILKRAMEKRKPIFGICLGSQLLSLAAGAQTYKLRYGHRGHNQPCIHLPSKKCYMTSQNHGYAIREDTLPDDWEVNYRNLNDGTVEGIRHKTLPFYAVQFHPEASPGPTDTEWIFEDFINAL
ncbi:MAG: Carbamoyl-phosphate synthase small chain [Chlamydiae bacterium]|nr:Carbamoyl-phosphate synthase small chain [Chlamydiota bacterium]